MERVRFPLGLRKTAGSEYFGYLPHTETTDLHTISGTYALSVTVAQSAPTRLDRVQFLEGVQCSKVHGVESMDTTIGAPIPLFGPQCNAVWYGRVATGESDGNWKSDYGVVVAWSPWERAEKVQFLLVRQQEVACLNNNSGHMGR